MYIILAIPEWLWCHYKVVYLMVAWLSALFPAGHGKVTSGLILYLICLAGFIIPKVISLSFVGSSKFTWYIFLCRIEVHWYSIHSLHYIALGLALWSMNHTCPCVVIKWLLGPEWTDTYLMSAVLMEALLACICILCFPFWYHLSLSEFPFNLGLYGMINIMAYTLLSLVYAW